MSLIGAHVWKMLTSVSPVNFSTINKSDDDVDDTIFELPTVCQVPC